MIVRRLAGGVGLYAVLVLGLTLGQRSLLYLPDGLVITPDMRSVPAEVMTTTTADGETIRLWWIAPRGDQPVVLHFHGNGGNLAMWSAVFRDLAAAGYGVLAVSYRGYGGSSGRPSEAGLIADARAAYARARELAPGAAIVAFGDSLGTGVAVALAAEAEVAGLVLNAPFTAVEDVAAETYWFAPVRLLIWDRFLSRDRIRAVRAPVLILHGDADEVVPFPHGERLYALANEPKRFVRIAGGGHINLWRNGGREAVLAFLDALRAGQLNRR